MQVWIILAEVIAGPALGRLVRRSPLSLREIDRERGRGQRRAELYGRHRHQHRRGTTARYGEAAGANRGAPGGLRLPLVYYTSSYDSRAQRG
jgi:hypothetical protein